MVGVGSGVRIDPEGAEGRVWQTEAQGDRGRRVLSLEHTPLQSLEMNPGVLGLYITLLLAKNYEAHWQTMCPISLLVTGQYRG